MIKFANQLKRYRAKFHFSQDDLAKKLHVTRQAISKWEANESSPDIQSLVKLANIFNISLDNLILGTTTAKTAKIDNSRFVYDPNKNKYVYDLKNLNIYEFLVHYWWIVCAILLSLGSIIHG